MSQPPFWLKINNRYVIENFEQLLKYVRAYNYISQNENEDSDFVQTYRHLKSVAEEYAGQINNLKIYDTPQFDIDFNKVTRIIAAAILTAYKMDTVEHDLISALVKLLILNHKNLIAPKIEQKYFNIICKCIRKCKIKSLELTWSDLDEDGFKLGPIETKLADTSFDDENASSTNYIYENRGCLMVNNDGLTLSSVNSLEYKKKRLKCELHTDQGIDVMVPSASAPASIEELLDLYPRIANEFDNMKSSSKPVLKRYNDTETIIMRVKYVSGCKIVAETIDPTYEYESGNVFIDPNINLIPREYLTAEIQKGDYLPVVRNTYPNLPFRISKDALTDFVKEYAKKSSEDYDDILAIHVADFKGGSRWLSEIGLFINIFENDVTKSGNEEGYNIAIRDDEPCLTSIHSWPTDANNNCLIKGVFAGLATEEVHDHEYFKEEAYMCFVRNFINYVFDHRPMIEEEAATEPIDSHSVLLLGMLAYQLALKTATGDSASRIRQLITAMLLVRMSGTQEDIDFVRAQFDYQKAIILFAKGSSPTALPLIHCHSEIVANEVSTEREIIDIIHDYKEITDGGANLRASLLRELQIADTRTVIEDLVRASNSLLNRIDITEINRIKKNICTHLNVADQYKDIYNQCTNYGVESDFLEFKASCTLPPDALRSSSLVNDMNYQKWTILKTVCAFLNSMNGGELLIGVSDYGFASGLDNDIQLLYSEHLISEPNADRLRTYVKLFIDKGFSTADGRVSGTAITAERVQFIIEKNEENAEILRLKISPYPWDVVKICASDRPNGFHDAYIRTSGASTPLDNAGIREIKLRKLNGIDKNLLKIAKIRQAIDENLVVEIKDYNGANGVSNRRIEPYKVYDNNKSFLAYDIDRHDMRLFKISRFKDADLIVTQERQKNQKKHSDRRLDIFGMVETATFPKENVRIKLTDYARCLMLEECEVNIHDEAVSAKEILQRNTDSTDNLHYPWMLNVNVYGFSGVARFVMGLPTQTKIHDTPKLDDYINRLTTANRQS